MRSFVLVTALALGASAAAAQPIVSVGTAGGATLGPGLFIAGRTGANGFTLGDAATVQAASFYGLECCGTPWSGTLRYLFFLPASPGSSSPGPTPFAQGTASSYLTTTLYSDGATNVIRRFDFNLGAPVTLPAGDYFFALTLAETDPGAGSVSWRIVQGGGVSASTAGINYASWTLQAGEAAFALYETRFATSAVPEPSTIVLLGAGLVLLGGLGVRRRGGRA